MNFQSSMSSRGKESHDISGSHVRQLDAFGIEHAKNMTVFVDRFDRRPSLSKEHDGSRGKGGRLPGGNRFHAAMPDCIRRYRSGVLRSGEWWCSGTRLRAVYVDLGFLVEVDELSGSSTAGSITDRWGARPRTKRYFLVQERVQDGDLSIRKVPTFKNCADIGTKPVSSQVWKQHCSEPGLVFLRPWIPHSTNAHVKEW